VSSIKKRKKEKEKRTKGTSAPGQDKVSRGR
jgi:hypothetical protein